jgi:hypothetical protein
VLGEAKKVHSSSGVLDSDKHVEPLAQDGVDMQEVDRENAASLGGEELSPTRSVWVPNWLSTAVTCGIAGQ